MLNPIINALRQALSASVALLVAALLVIMVLQIVARYGFNASLIWAEEICRYLLIWASFLAAFAAYERGEIAAVTLFQDRLPRAAGLLCAALCNLLGLVFVVTLAWYGLRYAERIGSQPIPALGFLLTDLFGPQAVAPSMFWVYLALPVGMGLLGIRLAVDLVRHLLMLGSGGHAADMRPLPGAADADATDAAT